MKKISLILLYLLQVSVASEISLIKAWQEIAIVSCDTKGKKIHSVVSVKGRRYNIQTVTADFSFLIFDWITEAKPEVYNTCLVMGNYQKIIAQEKWEEEYRIIWVKGDQLFIDGHGVISIKKLLGMKKKLLGPSSTQP